MPAKGHDVKLVPLDPRFFARGWSVILAVLVAVGLGTEFLSRGHLIPGFLEFDWTHDGLHVGLLALALFMGFRASPRAVQNYAKTVGFGGLALALLGFIPASNQLLVNTFALHLELGENVVHGLLGAWGLACGYRGTSTLM